jgi:hypothetical protein
MRQKSVTGSSPSERLVKTIRRATRKQYSAEEKIRIVLDGLRGESSIAELCRREGIAEGLYYSWSKEFLSVPIPVTSVRSTSSPYSFASLSGGMRPFWTQSFLSSTIFLRSNGGSLKNSDIQKLCHLQVVVASESN